jgi:hypothetical protein
MQKDQINNIFQKFKIWLSDFDSTILFNISRKTGKTLLYGGWLIFILWFSGRYLIAYDLEIFVFIGFLWVYFGFWAGILCLILLFIYSIININKLHLSIISTFIIVLLNIPSLLLILKLERKIEKKVFVKFENKSEIDNLQLNFIREKTKKNLGELDVNESTIFAFEPKYKIEDARIYQENEDIFIEVIYMNKRNMIEFPELPIGTCYKICLNEKFELEKNERIFWEID